VASEARCRRRCGARCGWRARRIRAFHARQRQASWRYRDAAGLVLGQNITPLRRVGV
jgi:histidinol dehydrogenase